MNKKYLAIVMEQLNNQRNNEILKSELVKEKALNIKEYKQLDNEERKLIVEIGKLKFENKDCSKQEQQLTDITTAKKQVLTVNNIDFNLLKPQFSCKKCEDTGFCNNEMCNCLKQRYNNYIMNLSNVTFKNVPYLTEYSVEIFEKSQQENIKKIVENLVKFANNLTTAKTKNLVLTGGTGVGKTYLAQSLAKEILKLSYTTLFISAFSLNNEFLKIHTSTEINKNLLLEHFVNVDLLIIDDLGTEPILKNVTTEYLLLLLNERVNANKSTIITTNLMPNQILDRYGERIYSRLNNKANCALFKLCGKDLRIN